MRATPIVLCLGLLVVTGPLMACAQPVAGGVAIADGQGSDPQTTTGVSTNTYPDSASSESNSAVETGLQYDVDVAATADSTAEGDSGTALTFTEAAATDTGGVSASLSGSASEGSQAAAGAVSGAESGWTDVTTDASTFTAPGESTSGAEASGWADPGRNDGNVDATAQANSGAWGDNADTAAIGATYVGEGQSTSVSGGYSTTGRKLRSHMP